MNRYIVIGFLFLFFHQSGWAQNSTITLHAVNRPLDSLLLQMLDKYDIHLSYSDAEMAKYKVTVSKSFQNGEDALNYILKDVPFYLKKSNDVFIIVFDKEKERRLREQNRVHIAGQVVESGTFEPLSFSNIIVNSHPLVADVTGRFNFMAASDSAFHVRISHLGYYVYDSIFHAGVANMKFVLLPSTQNLPEVTVRNNVIEKAALIGDQAGNMKLNHNIVRFLPGEGDNSIFNLLRLMPGVQSTNENSTDLLLWGSYEGQSLITFDGFTLFGLKDYNSNISIINPFVVKSIEIFKGGYDATYGNRIGGVVNITGKNGTLQKPRFSFNVNPTTLNGMVEMPVSAKSSLLLAYRQTYYNLYNLDDFNIFAPTRPLDRNNPGMDTPPNVSPRINVYPDAYQFRDFNAKYTVNLTNSDQFFVSFYTGGDNFRLSTDKILTQAPPTGGDPTSATSYEISLANHEKNNQLGISAFYSRKWKNGNVSQLIVAHSNYSKKVTDLSQSTDVNTDSTYQDQVGIMNEANESSVRLKHILNLSNGHQFEMGGGVYADQAQIENSTNYRDTLLVDTTSYYENNHAFLFFQDNLPLGERFILRSGLRFNMGTKSRHIYVEPRLSMTFKLSKRIKLNAAWGIYNQFMYKIANVDLDKNYTYVWITSKENSQVLHATHWLAGVNYFNKGLLVDVEGYYKTAGNLSRYILERRDINGHFADGYFLYSGDAKNYGIDAYVKKDFGQHSIWASYSLSKSLERLSPSGSPLMGWQPAPQDQRHEFKIAALFHVYKFFLSADYVYGSGMQIVKETFENKGHISYNRVDAAVIHHFNWKKLNGETGLSVLNVFDTNNLVSNNVKSINVNAEFGSIKIHTDAMPFTPVLFLKVVF